MHNQVSNELAPLLVSTRTSLRVCYNRKDTRKWVHKYKLWEQKTDSELLPFLYLFVHEEDPSGSFFYLPPAQTQLSRKSNQYLSQLFQRPGQCSYPGNPMPFSVFIRVISISLSMQIGTWTRSFGNISQKQPWFTNWDIESRFLLPSIEKGTVLHDHPHIV